MSTLWSAQTVLRPGRPRAPPRTRVAVIKVRRWPLPLQRSSPAPGRRRSKCNPARDCDPGFVTYRPCLETVDGLKTPSKPVLRVQHPRMSPLMLHTPRQAASPASGRASQLLRDSNPSKPVRVQHPRMSPLMLHTPRQAARALVCCTLSYTSHTC